MKTKLILKIQQEIAFLKEKLMMYQILVRQDAASLATNAAKSLKESTIISPNIEKRFFGHQNRCKLLKKKINEVEEFLKTLL